MIVYQKLCFLGKDGGDECYKKVFDKIKGLNSEEITNCMENSFITEPKDNKILKEEQDLKSKLGLQYYPSIVINQEIYRVIPFSHFLFLSRAIL